VEVRARITAADEPRVVCITRDVSERHRAEETLREAYALLAALVEGTTDHVFVKDAEARYALINPAGARFMGRPIAEILGRHDRELFPPEVAESIAARDTRVLETGETFTFETESWIAGEPRTFSATKGPIRNERGEITGLFGIMREITRQKRAERRLREQAEELRALSLVDELTGLYNRRGFTTLAQQQLATARRLGKKVALLFVDLDGLKPINDHFGHEAGDRALVAAADLLRACFRESDVIGRLGGDEFSVAAMEVSPGVVEVFSRRLERALAAFNASSNEPWMLAFSMGSVEFDPGAPQSLAELLQRADELMYAQKRARRVAR
jgi:diguanylate cyclase (GGDEF)-like protein/PAS domain S-box-containing protein